MTGVKQYLTELPEPRRAIITELHELIRTTAPELAPRVWDSMANPMIGYGTYRYKYASGREGEWFVVGLANQKRYVSLYVCAVVDGAYLAETYADRLGKVSVGRSCIRFTKLENIKLDVVAEMVTEADNAVADGRFGM